MRASSPSESSGVAGVKASSSVTTLLITDRPRHSVLPPAITSPVTACSPRSSWPLRRPATVPTGGLPLSRKPCSARLPLPPAVFDSAPDQHVERRRRAMGESSTGTETTAGRATVLHGLAGLQERAGQKL